MARARTIYSDLLYIGAAVCLLLLAGVRLRGLLANTALLACGTIVIALPIGALLGIVIGKIDLPGRRVIGWTMAALLFVPLYVQAAAWNAVLGAGGWIPQALAGGGYANPWLAGWRGAIWIHAMGAVPWIALMTAASLRTVERRLEEESLVDASPFRVLVHVTLRRGLGGLLTAAVWIAIICATEIAVTDLFQIRTFAEEIFTEASLGGFSGESSDLLHSDLAIGVTLVALLVGLLLRLIGPWLPKAASIAADATWQWRPTRGRAIFAAAAWSLFAATTLLPLAGLMWKAGIAVHQQDGHFERSWSMAKIASMIAESPWEHRREWGWSLASGAMAAAATVIVAVPLAWSARRRPGTAKVLAALVAIGFAVPAPLWGVWAIALLNQPPESLLSPLTTLYDRTLLAPVLVQTVRAWPLVGLWIYAHFLSVPQDLLDAARSEGAGSINQLFRIAVPLRKVGVAAAAGLALVLAVSELSATMLVAPPGVTPISVRIFQLLHYGVDDRVAAVALSIFAIAAGAVIVAQVAGLVRRRTD